MEKIEENRVSCSNCGHKWYKRTERPLQCPKCTVRTWDRNRLPKETAPNNIEPEQKQAMEKKQTIDMEDEWF